MEETDAIRASIVVLSFDMTKINRVVLHVDYDRKHERTTNLDDSLKKSVV